MNVTEVLQMLQSCNNFTLYRMKVPGGPFARHARVCPYTGYIRAGQAGSCKLGNISCELQAASWMQ